jgi:hypothetical protein
MRVTIMKKSNAPRKKKTVTKNQKNAVKGGAPFSEQDPKRRLGNFSGMGEHPRQGGRTSGVVGQTKRRNHTDKRGK